MATIPEPLIELIRKQPGTVDRGETEDVLKQLKKLGVKEDSQFATFFLQFSPLNFTSSVSFEELNDIARPTAQIAEATEFVQETWELPSEYLCLTTAEGEGCYLYSKETEAVYDFDLANREEFLSCRPDPIASDFYGFLLWYLGESESEEAS